MYGALISQRSAIAGLILVSSREDIEYLVKESEVVTGRPGRRFLVCGADRLSYHVQWQPTGFRVHCLDERNGSNRSAELSPDDFDRHCLGEALRAGQLFTPVLIGDVVH